MRIGVLTTSFPRAPDDTAGCFVLDSARALADRGHRVEVLAPEPANGAAPPRFAGVTTHWVPYLRPRALQRTFYGDGVPDNLARDPAAWPGLASFPPAQLASVLGARNRWDAIISHWALPSALSAGAVRGGRPHLAVLHSADLHALGRLPARRALAALVARCASSLCFVSNGGRERFLSLLSPAARADVDARALVQPMGVMPPPALEAGVGAYSPRAPGARFRLVSVGRLVPVKGLVEAATSLARRDDLEWLVLGEGPLAPELRRIAARARLRLELRGNVTGAAKDALLASADAFVLPSRVLPGGRTEGAPHALLEAMARGLPVVAAAVGGVTELVRDGESGLLFDPRMAHALGHAVTRLQLEPGLSARLGAAARRAAEPHLWPAVAARLEAALDAPAPPRRAPPATQAMPSRFSSAGFASDASVPSGASYQPGSS